MYDIIRAFQDAGIEFFTASNDHDERGEGVTYWYQREDGASFGKSPPSPVSPGHTNQRRPHA